MKSNFIAALAGALFAVGLAVSGMTQPGKVVGFLDLAGAWDASLAFVMGGAVLVYAIASRLILKRGRPLFDIRFHVPTRRDLDLRLMAGAATFGVGWGLGGYCPGPGLVSMMSGAAPAIVFVVGMTLGILVQHQVGRKRNWQTLQSLRPPQS